mmetsp:Transcript_48752/g.110427  ORF Transcript_48752/g.110427 Transcript_48752/m.110427 type:complete len:651 (-) Transcript_48752:200-2152(-)
MACCAWRGGWKRLAILSLACLAAVAFFADWGLMSRLWEAHVGKLSALVLTGNNTSVTAGHFLDTSSPTPSINPPGTGQAPHGLSSAASIARLPTEEPVAGAGSNNPAGPRLYKRGTECRRQAFDLGAAQSPSSCGGLVSAAPECGMHFMFSRDHPDWRCRCCMPNDTGGGAKAPWWDLYEVNDVGTMAPRVPAAPPAPTRVVLLTTRPTTSSVVIKPFAAVTTPSPRTTEPTVIAEPPAPLPGMYKDQYHAKTVECAEQAYNFGHIPTVEKCDKLTAATPECGNYFMFSKSHPDWACRCCAPFGENDGPGSEQWDVYKRLFPRLKTILALPTVPPQVDPFHGLPVTDGPRPAWLAREDALVVDARPESQGGILILQAVLTDVNSLWGAKRSTVNDRPEWLRAILATNRAHAIEHGHVMVLRAQPTQPQLTKWMVRACGDHSTSYCVRQNERENFNWEKHLMMSDYLTSAQKFSHVLMLDADAALIQPQLDTLRRISAILDNEGKDVFLTDEDWLDANGKGRINGGLMFARNTNFTRNLFLDTFDAHVKGPALHKNWRIGVPVQQCTSNEQICLNDLWYGQNNKYFRPYAMMASGKQYNRGAERGGEAHMNDPATEIMHWMGGSKGSAGRALCKGARDLTGEGPNGYGCKA